MKKFFLAFLVLAAIISTSFVQAQPAGKKHLIISIPTRTSTLNTTAEPGDFIWITSDSTLYMTKVRLGPGNTGTYLLAARSRYVVGATAWVSGAVGATVITASSTLGVTGATTLNSTLAVAGNVAVNTNKFTVTAASGNTLIAGTLSATGNVAVNTDKFTVVAASGNTAVAGTLGVTGATTLTGAVTLSNALTGTVLIRDSIAFSGALTRTAKAITGATATDVYTYASKAPGSATRPVAGDFCNFYAKADSVICMRQAGTTSGLVVYFFRAK